MVQHHKQQQQQQQPQQGDDGAGVVVVPTVEDWSEQNQRVVVRTSPGDGLLADIVLRAKVEGTPDDVYGVLKDPRSHAIFRGIKATLERRKLSDDGRGRRTLLVSHQAVTRFLWLHVTFNTQLLVEEDDRARTITFKNAREGGFMRTFTGKWEVSPFSQDTLDRIYKPPHEQSHKGRFGWLSPVGAVGALQHRLSDALGHNHARPQSLVTLEQAIAPRAMPPPPLMRLVASMCARTVKNMMADLQTELGRRRDGEGETGNSSSSSSSSSSRTGASSAASPAASITACGLWPITAITIDL